MENTEITVYDKIKLTRKAGRATALNYIQGILAEFIEMHGDRTYGDDHAIVAGIGMLRDMPVTVVGIDKGHTLTERIDRGFGCVLPEGYRKALRLMKQAEKFGRPVICFVDTQGANCGRGAEERGEGEAIARNLYEISALKVPVITVMIGEGGSGGALALGVADQVWMLENAYYSVISPESCASILFKDPSRAPEAAEHLKLTADDLLSLQIIEKKLAEPADFTDDAERTHFMEKLSDMLYKELKKLKKTDVDALLAARYEKYRKIGRYEQYKAENAGSPKRKGWFRHGK